jgi:hypothetical protein
LGASARRRVGVGAFPLPSSSNLADDADEPPAPAALGAVVSPPHIIIITTPQHAAYHHHHSRVSRTKDTPPFSTEQKLGLFREVH